MAHTEVIVKLPAHRIVYTGLDARIARGTAALFRKAGLKVERQRVRVLGSKRTDPNPWHYTIIVHGLTQDLIDSVLS